MQTHHTQEPFDFNQYAERFAYREPKPQSKNFKEVLEHIAKWEEWASFENHRRFGLLWDKKADCVRYLIEQAHEEGTEMATYKVY